jgi:hypothetical protein
MHVQFEEKGEDKHGKFNIKAIHQAHQKCACVCACVCVVKREALWCRAELRHAATGSDALPAAASDANPGA